MNEEAAFLAAIRETPDDRLLRLVYADWLEDQGDERAEQVRVEEEIGPLPVYSERFAVLKHLRTEMRLRANPDWLAAMGYDTLGPPVFAHGIPDGLEERWRLIREFASRWCMVPPMERGDWSDEIREIETRIGRTLPESLRQWVSFDLDRKRVLTDRFDASLGTYPSWQIGDFGKHRAVAIMQSERDVWTIWGILHSDFDHPDPPVYQFVFNNDPSSRGEIFADRHDLSPTHPIAPTLSAHVLGLAIASTRSSTDNTYGTVQNAEPLRRRLRLFCPSYVSFEGADVFETGDCIIALHLHSDEALIEAPTDWRWVVVTKRHPHAEAPGFIRDYLDE